MSYTPTEWESADIVTATRINKLETAVGDMDMSYTPNTWSDGDILSADKMNALEQAVASGGGGSSDFSTAEVTIINNSEHETACYAATIVELPIPALPSFTEGIFSISGNTTIIKNVILYKGEGDMSFETSGTLSGSGDVEIDGTIAYVTGDGTITIS